MLAEIDMGGDQVVGVGGVAGFALVLVAQRVIQRHTRRDATEDAAAFEGCFAHAVSDHGVDDNAGNLEHGRWGRVGGIRVSIAAFVQHWIDLGERRAYFPPLQRGVKVGGPGTINYRSSERKNPLRSTSENEDIRQCHG